MVKQVTNAAIGFAGPINLKVDKILVDEQQFEIGEKIYNNLVNSGISTILDDTKKSRSEI